MSVKFATCNLYQYAEPPIAWYQPDSSYSTSEWQFKQQWLTEQLALMDADVVGFQEVFSVEALRDLVAAAGYPEFAVVDSPKQDSNNANVFYSPVVAIASKHPIKSVGAVPVDTSLLGHWPIAADFQFSRLPIKAVIALPKIGDTCVYVAHLKSKRATQSGPVATQSSSPVDKVFAAAKANSLGQVVSMVQRGLEATMIYHDVVTQINHNNHLPIVVLGDMNDTNHSVAIDGLTNQNARFDVDGQSFGHWTVAQQAASFQAKLYDAYFLTPNQSGGPRVPTHFHNKAGNVVDFIFVSNAFNFKNPGHIALPIKYSVFNNHLLADGVGNQKQSDHGFVVLVLKPTSSN